MEKNIYDVLNEVEINIDDYEIEEMTELEQKRIMSRFFNKKSKKNNHYRKYAVAASIVAFSLGAVGILPTIATINPVAYKIATMIGMEKSLDDYSTVVNKPISKEGITVGIGEIVYDRANHKLIVTMYMTSANPIQNKTDYSKHQLHEKVFINGKSLNTSSSWYGKIVDENTVAYVASYNMEEELTGEFDMTIWIPQLFIDGEEYRNSWKFDFTVDGDKLATDTQVIELSESIELANGKQVNLIKYTSNVFGKSIYYISNGLADSYLLKIRGKDDLGNTVIFDYADGVHGEIGEFKLVEEKSALSPDAKSLTLQVYALALPEQDGPIEGEYMPMGQEFVIEINR